MFGTRLFSGAILLALTAVFLIWGGIPLLTILAVISIVGFLELTKATGIYDGKGKRSVLEMIGILGIVCLYTSQIVAVWKREPIDSVLLFGIVILTVIVFLAFYVITFPQYEALHIAQIVFAFMYVPVMLSFIGMTRALPEIGEKVVWLIWISAWGSDTFAYCVGMLTARTIGNHKAFPKLSPKKSYEGCVGGIVGAALLGMLFGKVVMGTDSDMIWMAVISAVGSVISQCGDLAASAIKRNYNIKDYGKCIPGHGGILDRFDSIIFTAPCVYFMVYFFIS